MNTGTFLCLLLVHFAADFPFQFERIVNRRNDQNKRISLYGNLIHSCMHFALSLIPVLFFRSAKLFAVVVAITVTHFIIDCLKSKAIACQPFRKYSIVLFFMDQAAHIISITLALLLINTASPVQALLKIFQSGPLEILSSFLTNLTYEQKLMLSIILLIVGLWVTGIFIRLVFGRMANKAYKTAINLKIELAGGSKNDGAADGGFIIGILERLFIIISIILNMPIVIGFILTVKSVARLKKFGDERFVEIFIIGSFISFIVAIIIGYMIKFLRVVPY